MGMCKKHAKSAQKVVQEKKAAQKAVQEGLSKIGSASDTENDSGEAEADTCTYVFTKGGIKGQTCGKAIKAGSDMCSKHAAKKAKGEKIEKSERVEGKSTAMTSTDQVKHMSAALMEVLTGILNGALKDKYATKAIEALQSDEAQEALAQVIKDKIPTKVIKATGKRGGRRKGKPKDNAVPKKNCSSYIFFCKDARKQVKDEHDDWKATEVTAEIGRIWKEEMTEEMKKPYVEMAVKDKERYEREMKDYEPSPEFQAELEAWE